MDTNHSKLGLLLVAIILLLTSCRTFTERLPAKTTPTESLPTKTTRTEPGEGIGSTKINPVDGMVMVYVPEGEFLMGSDDEEAFSHEKPVHLVYLDAYWIYQTEVTNLQYNQCIQAEGCKLSVWGEKPDDDYPVTQVLPRDGRNYCKWAGGRLPTEAEWEKAARGTDGRKYPWGNEPITGERANFCDVNCDEEWGNPDISQDDGYAQTAPVGSFPAGASPYGALDMAGNVWEWVSDSYDPDYYSNSPYRNPKGPQGDDYIELTRGGSWLSRTSFRITYRFSLDGAMFDEIYFETFGFRCMHPDE